jgi:hypothetical protein
MTDQLIQQLLAEQAQMRNLLHHLAHQASLQTRIQQEMYYETILRSPKYDDPKMLTRFERQVFSQNGEDGIIEEIFRRIGTSSKYFVEIGVGNGLQNNSAYLLWRGWRGIWVDGNAKDLEYARKEFAKPIAGGALKIIMQMVTPQNIMPTLEGAGVLREMDLLSVDIDRNTHALWGAMGKLSPRVVVAEYNASLPPGDSWRVHDAPNGFWNGSFYFGASLKAFDEMARERGYSLVGCDTSGTNAFFVRGDLLGEHFSAPFTPEHHYEPPRYFLNRTIGHPPRFTDGATG